MLRRRRAIAMRNEFPIEKSDVDFQIQELISQDLENAAALQAANPEEVYSDAELYPVSTKRAGVTWLAPLLRRIRWQTSRGDEAFQARAGVISMVNVVIQNLRPVTVDQFVALSEHADCFIGAGAAAFFNRMLYFAKSLDKSGSLDGRAAAAFARVLEVVYPIWRTSPFWRE